MIAQGLAKSGCKVDVVTWNDRLTGTEEREEGFRVHRVSNPVRTHVNIVTWALTLNTELERIAADIIYEGKDQAKLVHASEWICVPAAIQLKKTLHTQYLLSLYSTETERSIHGGPLSGVITYLEKSGCLQAAKIIVHSMTRASIVQKSYGVPADRLTILDPAAAPISKLIDQYQATLSSLVIREEPSDIQ
jgi:hypothetical protein